VRRLDEAMGVLNSIQPKDSPQRLLQVGEAQRLLGDATSAVEAYARAADRARAEMVKEPLLEGTLAYCLARLQSYEEADAAANSALSKQPANIHALAASVVIAIRRGSLDAAYDAIWKMIVVSPYAALGEFRDPDSAALLADPRLKTLFAWALGAQRQTRERLRQRFPHLFA
jgi:tetratricopeptide (TPR) repeat protein